MRKYNFLLFFSSSFKALGLKVSLSALSVLFWLFMVCFAVFVYFFTDHLIKQHQQQMNESASISAKGVAKVINERIHQQKLMVESLVFHKADTIYELSQGKGNSLDLFKILEHVKNLLPEATQLSILDEKGQLIAGSEKVQLSSVCWTQMKESTEVFPNTVSFLGAHTLPNGTIHYDVIFPLSNGAQQAMLFLSFNFDVLQSFIMNVNTDKFDFILVNSLLGTAEKIKVIFSGDRVGDSPYGQVLEKKFVDNTLVNVPVLNGKWSLLGVAKKDVFSNDIRKIYVTSLIIFITFFVLMLLFFRSLDKMDRARKRLENNTVQDTLFNTGPTVLFQKKADKNMAVEYVSPNVGSLLGCGVQNVLNSDSFMDLILLEDVATVRETILNAFTHLEKEVGLEYRVRHSQHQGYLWVYDLTRILYDSQGKPIGLQSYVTSIHAQKMAEHRANRLIESAPDAMAITDRYGVVLRVNQAFEKMFGYEREDLYGLSLDLCVYETSQGLWHQHIIKIVEQEGFESVLLGGSPSVMAITKEGGTFSVEVGVSRVDSHDGIQLVHMIRDITIQTQAKKQMQIAKESAEDLAMARSRFVATMSHEIRTPLNGVLGMSNLLMNTALDAQQEMYLGAIERSGQALLKVVNGILDFAKLDEGGVRLESKAFDLNAVVRDVVQILHLQAQENDVELFFESDLPEYITLIGDAARVQQVLLNLLSNAIKFSPQGRVDLLIKAQSSEDSFDMTTVVIEVKDNGIGIAEGSLDRLFDSFTQADDSTTREFGGTGLGLAISKQLVTLMGGTIGVISELGSGSLFWVDIPFKSSSTRLLSDAQEGGGNELLPALPPPTSEMVLSNHALNKVLEGKTILLIEDNDINQEIVLAFVQRLGGRIDFAKNGLEGLSFWRMHAQKYDLILMDCQMPVMDGYEATILIRKEEALSSKTSPIPIIALTANAMPEDRDRCFAVGMNGYITKPIDIELFNQTLIKWLC